jgi:hypothetical protein
MIGIQMEAESAARSGAESMTRRTRVTASTIVPGFARATVPEKLKHFSVIVHLLKCGGWF